MRIQWRVRKTKSGKRWATWRSHSKKKTAKIFIKWADAISYAECMAYIDRTMGVQR